MKKTLFTLISIIFLFISLAFVFSVRAQTTCHCGTNSNCSSCIFEKISSFSYSNPVKCDLLSSLFPQAVSLADKDSWCNRSYRTLGDADGLVDTQGKRVTQADYYYYVSAVNGGKIPVTVSPDFNGDGLVSPEDRLIIVYTLINGEPTLGGPTITLTPTPTIPATPSVAPTLIPTPGCNSCYDSSQRWYCCGGETCGLIYPDCLPADVDPTATPIPGSPTNTPTPTRTPTPTPLSTCGNGTTEPPEECDGTNQECDYMSGEECTGCRCVMPPSE